MDVARKDGALVAVGGTKIEGPGYFFAPTLFSDAAPSMRVAQEEIFGPVLTAIRFTDEADAPKMTRNGRWSKLK